MSEHERTVDPTDDDTVVDDATLAVAPFVDDATIVVTAVADDTIPREVVGDATVAVPPSPAAPPPSAPRERPHASVAVPPWEAPPRGEVGVHPSIPVVYGPRPIRDRLSTAEGDEVARSIGPAPAAVPVSVRAGREALPSLLRRERRRRRRTLLLYPLVVMAAVAGLLVLATVAFA